MPRLIYSEYAPLPRLAEVVDCLWTVFVDPAGSGQPMHWVVPDGCCTLSVGLHPHFYVRLRSPALIPFRAPCTPGERIAGLRFRPGVNGAGLVDELRKRLRPGAGSDEAMALAQHLLLAGCVREPEGRTAGLVSLVRARDGVCAVQEVASAMGITDRQVERIALSSLGLAPKAFLRVTRLQRVLRHMIAKPESGLAAVAADGGFADQTHMTREFQSLAGLTPANYRRMIRDVGFVLEAGPAPQ